MATDNSTIIRCSALPSYMDCNRRAAAKAFADDVRGAGYELRELPPSVASALGTGAHFGVECALRAKMESGLLLTERQTLEAAAGCFADAIAPGVVWDDTTPNMNAAMVQLKRQVEAYLPVAALIKPVALELSLSARVGDGFELSGHIDIVDEYGMAPGYVNIRDEKYGAREGQYWLQLGGYALLARTANFNVGALTIDWVQRVGKTKHQPGVVSTQYDVQRSQSDAYQVVQRIKMDVQQFRKAPDRLWTSFPANPMSLMCSDKYCPAHGTKFCDAWKHRESKTSTIHDREFPI